jgi:holo-[acyl-carrier protein] synthase
MIFGVGTDIVAIARLGDLYRKHGERALTKILAPGERDDCRAAADPARFLAKRFAAKEAFGKALGTGIRAPVVLPAIAVTHDALGRPGFQFAPELAALMAERHLIAHLSISDEADLALAFVVLERMS